jgi:gamma-butyrobetaine dioxygenase
LRAAKPDDIDRFYEAFSLLESFILEKGYQYEYLMKSGDLVLFANRRVLHGRHQFNPLSGSRWLKGTYVGWDEVKDRIRMMKKFDK